MGQINKGKEAVEYRPFFSIILPTRNRPHLVAFALESLSRQEFGDFEVILSDNADGDLVCKELVDKLADSRIRYFRTSGDLSMPDNWEFALSKAKGEYVTVLEDKQVYFPNTLKIVYDTITANNFCTAVCWHNDILDDTLKSQSLVHYLGDGCVYHNSSDAILHRLTESLSGWSKVPRMINSALRRDFICSLKTKYGMPRFFIDVNPDICASIMQLADIDEIIYIDLALCVTGGIKYSNGRNSLSRSNKKMIDEFISKIDSNNLIYSHVELKEFRFPNNSVVNDYLRLRECLGKRLLMYNFSSNSYARVCFRDMMRSFVLGVDIRKEAKMLICYMHKYLNLKELVKFVPWGMRIFMNLSISRWLFNHPKVANNIYRLRGINTRLYPGCQLILDVVGADRFRPTLKSQ